MKKKDENSYGAGKKPTKNPQKRENKALAYFGKHMVSTILFLMIIIGLYSAIAGNHKEKTTVAFSQFASFVADGSIASISVNGNKIIAKKVDGTEIVTTKETENALSEALITYGVPKEKLITVPITVDSGSGTSFWLMLVLPILAPIIVIGLIMFYMARQMKGANGQALSFGNSRARLTDPNDKNNKVTFADVAGAREAKEELVEIVDFLRNPKKFLDIGAQIPKGVLLTGAPGTGKTLLARAVAGEAGVPFFHLSGSEFVEMFVGVGASRVRDLFKMAKKASPAIVFIDEIDAVGRVRGHGTGGGNDEREQTLNQILVEMDGFEPTEKVIVMAATNRSDVLDPALLRPGRFDRRVTIDLPDRRDREEILMIHARKKPFAEDVDLKLIAERTPGFSGADLYSLMNESAILAARENRTTVVQNDLLRSIEKVMIGPERKSHLFTQKEKKITAYHEAGHALVSSILPDADPVHKVSIIARGRAGGYTLKLPLEERKLQSKKEFLDDIAMSLGGYVAEEMIMGDITTGPSNDLQVATNLARAMVTRWGMSDAIGPVALESDGGRALFGSGVGDKEYSESMSMKIDAEVSKIMNDALARAREVLTKHRNILDAIAEKLMEVETLEQQEYEEILKKYSIPLKKLEITN